MNAWIQANWPTLAAFLAGVGIGWPFLKWFAGRELQRHQEQRALYENRFLDHEARLRAMELDRVTKDNFDELRVSMMSTFTHGHDALATRIGDIRDDIAWLKSYLLGRK